MSRICPRPETVKTTLKLAGGYMVQFVASASLSQVLIGQYAHQFMQQLEKLNWQIDQNTRRVHISGGIALVSAVIGLIVVVRNAQVKKRELLKLQQANQNPSPIELAECYPGYDEHMRTIFSGAFLLYACDLLDMTGQLNLGWLIAITVCTAVPAAVLLKSTVSNYSDQVIRANEYQQFPRFDGDQMTFLHKALVVLQPLPKAAGNVLFLIWCIKREIAGQTISISPLEIGLASTYVLTMFITSLNSRKYPGAQQVNMSVANGIEALATTYAAGSNVAQIFLAIAAVQVLPDYIRYPMMSGLLVLSTSVAIYRASTTLYRFQANVDSARSTLNTGLSVLNKVKGGASVVYNKITSLFSCADNENIDVAAIVVNEQTPFTVNSNNT